MSKLTADQAEARAEEREAQRRDYERMPRADCFREASALDVVDMWRTQKNLDGRRLTKFEFGCLVERWTEIFGKCRKLMAIRQAMTFASAPEPMPADDTMLRVPDVVRLTGISHTTIKRMQADGRFPKAMRLGERAKGWPAREIKAWLETLDEQRRRSRQ
jgi:prophage regulatory protein